MRISIQHLLEFYAVGWLRKSGFEAHLEHNFESGIVGAHEGL